MNKEEILKKSRLENKDMDERERKIDDNSIINGMIGILVLALLYIFFKIFTNQPYADMLSIMTANITITSFYKLKKTSSKKYLLSGVLGASATIGFIIAYVIEVI